MTGGPLEVGGRANDTSDERPLLALNASSISSTFSLSLELASALLDTP